MIPPKLTIPSDDTIIELKHFNDKTKIATYIYVKSLAKLGMELKITEEQLQKNIKNNLLVKI